MALTVVGVLAGVAGRSNAGLAVNPDPFTENRLGYIADGGSHGTKLVYDDSGASSLPAGGPFSDGGTSSYSNSDVAVSNTTFGTARGTTFDLKSTASAEILRSSASFAYAHALNEYVYDFVVSSPQTFHTSVSLTADASSSGRNNSFEYLALAYLYDTTTGNTLYDTSYVFTYGKGSYNGVPSTVELLAGHQYSLFGETYAYADS